MHYVLKKGIPVLNNTLFILPIMVIKTFNYENIKGMEKMSLINEIERKLLADKQMEERNGSYYLVPHNLDIAEYPRDFSCPCNIDSESRYVPVLKKVIRELIENTIDANQNSIKKNCCFHVFSAGEDAFSSYTNHMSDIDNYYFNGNVNLTLIYRENKWELEAIIEGEVNRAI